MARVPVLTSGRFLQGEGLLDSGEVPEGLGAGEDWAVLHTVDVGRDGGMASLAGEYWSAGYRRFLGSGVVADLEPFHGERVRGLSDLPERDGSSARRRDFPLLTDPALVEEFDQEFGQVDFQEYYQS